MVLRNRYWTSSTVLCLTDFNNIRNLTKIGWPIMNHCQVCNNTARDYQWLLQYIEKDIAKYLHPNWICSYMLDSWSLSTQFHHQPCITFNVGATGTAVGV